MIFGPIVLVIVTVLYLIAAADFFVHGKAGMGITFVAYAMANIGLLIEAMRK